VPVGAGRPAGFGWLGTNGAGGADVWATGGGETGTASGGETGAEAE
jgi:hypothetical protein